MVWPLDNEPAEDAVETESTYWTVKTYYKKNVEQHEYFYNRELKGAEIIVKDGYRFAEYTVETNDGNPPEFNFTQCPGGSDDPDSIDLNSCFGDNVESTELVELFDGGCWGDIEINGIHDEDEAERLEELVNEEGSWALEDDGDGNWYLSDTEVWAWGPFEITNDEGYSRIIIADADGNAVDFKEE
jgi:hypothetical protein